MLPVTIKSRWEYRGDEAIHVAWKSGDDVFYGDIFTDEQPGFWRRLWRWICGEQV